LKKIIWGAEINRYYNAATLYCSDLYIKKEEKVLPWMPLYSQVGRILIMHYLAQRKGMTLHSAGLVIHGKACIFPGKCGTGKSTMMRQFASVNRPDLLSDDRIIVREIEDKIFAYGTPWPGQDNIAQNAGAPLACMFFISHGTTNRIKDMSPQQAMEKLYPVVSMPWYDREAVPKLLDFMEEVVKSTPSVELQCKPDTEVVDIVSNFISSL
jgi:hypothetical protein